MTFGKITASAAMLLALSAARRRSGARARRQQREFTPRAGHDLHRHHDHSRRQQCRRQRLQRPMVPGHVSGPERLRDRHQLRSGRWRTAARRGRTAACGPVQGRRRRAMRLRRRPAMPVRRPAPIPTRQFPFTLAHRRLSDRPSTLGPPPPTYYLRYGYGPYYGPYGRGYYYRRW